jgi:NAD(P)H-quinone oxidoreductase subunit 3
MKQTDSLHRFCRCVHNKQINLLALSVYPKEIYHMDPGVGSQYILAGVMLIVALLLAFLMLVIHRVLVPREQRPEQNPPPEHGGRTGHKTWVQFRVRYAVLALLFVAFDMEMVFMFPWAVAFKQVGLVAFFDMFVFVAILVSAIIFAWKEGAFDWER